MKLIDFQPHHARLIVPQEAQKSEVNAQSMAAPYGTAWTAVHDGLPVACGGFIDVWPGRAYAWALIDVDCGPHMLSLTREIRSLVARAPYNRLEMAVDAEFEAGCRWAVLLGFERESLARKYLPSGRDAWIYARV